MTFDGRRLDTKDEVLDFLALAVLPVRLLFVFVRKAFIGGPGQLGSRSR
jgi:hypothetical protein